MEGIHWALSLTLHGRQNTGRGWPCREALEAVRWVSGCACPHPALGYMEPSVAGAFSERLWPRPWLPILSAGTLSHTSGTDLWQRRGTAA